MILQPPVWSKLWRIGPAIALSLLVSSGPARIVAAPSEVFIGIKGVQRKKRVLGLAAFTPKSAKSKDDVEACRKLREILRQDLLFSRYLDLVEDSPPADLPKGEATRKHWINQGATLLLEAKVSWKKGRLTVGANLKTLSSDDTIFSRRYRQDTEYWRSVAHRLADDLVRQITGRRGVSNTRIAFVNDQTGSKEIYLMDYDGARLKRLTFNRSINLLPRWHPGARKIAFTSYKDGNPDIFLFDLASGLVKPLSTRQGLNLPGGFSPDGVLMAATLSRGTNPNIFILGVKARSLTPVTKHWGVDSSPTFSPDGESLAFVSDRAGNPQVHTVDLATGRTKRLTHLNWTDSPSWSPSGEWIAFSGRAHRKDSLDIFLVDITGTKIIQLTHGEGSNESPSWSPDGRFIVFTSTRDKRRKIYIMDADGSTPHSLGNIPKNSFTPEWST